MFLTLVTGRALEIVCNEMFIDLGIRVTMTDEQFHEAMAERREALDLGPNDHVSVSSLRSPLVAPILMMGDSNEVAGTTKEVNESYPISLK
ncbi:MAG: hypothetical protein Ct9H90mP25_4740 [Gammaproteobacteria bacterium]|nr:MAG: hypothetical protein Ct9H90mP25_4740 [Gammaproteobacteria bacterium]